MKNVVDRRRRFQFRLDTLILAALFVGVIGLLTIYRKPWALISTTPLHQEWESVPSEGDAPGAYSPNRKRYIIAESRTRNGGTLEGPILVYAISTDGQLVDVVAELGPEDKIRNWRFVSDTDIEVLDTTNTVMKWHRRFPEFWWGHLYRPELWAAVLLGGALLMRAIAWWKGTDAKDERSGGDSMSSPAATPEHKE